MSPRAVVVDALLELSHDVAGRLFRRRVAQGAFMGRGPTDRKAGRKRDAQDSWRHVPGYACFVSINMVDTVGELSEMRQCCCRTVGDQRCLTIGTREHEKLLGT